MNIHLSFRKDKMKIILPRRTKSMNKQRAQEISLSAEMANVSYNGTPVYIQHVAEDNDTVRIYPLDNPEQEQAVNVNDLREDYRH
jgi:small acid-soluble spore protein H (minor)